MSTLLIEGESTIRANRAEVWAALHDLEILRRCVPGVQSLTRDTHGVLLGAVELAVGRLRGTLHGRVTITETQAPERMTLALEARAPFGVVKASGRLELTEQDGGTRVRWAGTPQLSGLLATFGSRLLGGVVQQKAEHFFQRLEREACQLGAEESPVGEFRQANTLPRS
ncbi:SRPBCC family protein [Deinococcus peraridilitoris]|uniref:Carbon monoxide dehydrogenase subunit G n=1 Tax=Deinococcus peraridilitoris (strain DSM 19664 / LMG 22246 / CIP 109416 / KR-200) TaxID=937777 RepID=L0A484_DEIPD|nr:carbon monoxide dehydrogenase subunit G [Deinococcus peraridilitoris]AFZ67840.1 hypothetical protein Deipe_2362 [Deinococcus peraridilitoris DSM 19664]